MNDHVQTIQSRTAANDDLTVRAPHLVGRFAFDLAADQPLGSLPNDVLNDVDAALAAGQTHYVDVPGIGRLRELLASQLSAGGRSTVAADGVVVTAGMQEARFLAVQVLAESLPVVAVPDVVHPGMRNALGVRPPHQVLSMRTAPEGGNLAPVEEVARVLAAGARLVVLESPSRLTGATYDASEVQAIAELVARHDAHVVLDDGMAPWCEPPNPSLALEPAAAGRVTVIGEVLPGTGLEAWALGFIATSKERVAGFTKLKQIMSICTSTPSQLAAIEVLRRGSERASSLRPHLLEARRAAVATATELGWQVLPGSALNVVAVVGRLPVGAADGAAFGAPGVARLRVDGSATTAVLRSAAPSKGGQ